MKKEIALRIISVILLFSSLSFLYFAYTTASYPVSEFIIIASIIFLMGISLLIWSYVKND